MDTDHLECAFDRATVGIFQTAPDGLFLRVNPTLARLLGYDSPAALMATVNNIAHQLYVDPLRREQFMRMARDNGAVMNFESQVFRRSGKVIWISENAWGVPNAAGQLAYFEGFVEDITEQKRGAERARQSEAVAAASLAQSKFKANISHELRTPLNGVIGMLDLLRGTELSPQQQRYVRVAGASADSLLSLLNDVRDLSEIEAGQAQFEESDDNLHQLLEDVADLYIERVEDKGPIVAPASAAGGKASEACASPFDLESLLHRCLGDTTFCSMILQKFADRSGDLLARLDRAANSANAVELALQAHTVMGVAANLSADKLRSRSAELERLANVNPLPQMSHALAEVRDEVERCRQAVPQLLAEIGASAPLGSRTSVGQSAPVGKSTSSGRR